MERALTDTAMRTPQAIGMATTVRSEFTPWDNV